MKYLLIFFSSISATFACCQDIDNVMHIHNPQGGMISAMATDGSFYLLAFTPGQYVQIGDTEYYDGLTNKALIVFKNGNHQTIWTKTVEFMNYEFSTITDACFDNSGNILLCGTSRSDQAVIDDLVTEASGFLIKLNAAGETQWLHGIANCQLSSIAVTSINDAVVAGSFTDTLSYGNQQFINVGIDGIWFPPIDACIMSLSPNGDEQWVHSYGTVFDEELTDLQCDSNDFIYAIGQSHADTLHFNNQNVYFGTFLFKYDSNGIELWHRNISPSIDENYNGVSQSLRLALSENGSIYWINSFASDTLITPVQNIYAQDCDFLDEPSIKAIFRYNTSGELLNVFGIGCVNRFQSWAILPLGDALLVAGEFLSTTQVAESITLTSEADVDNGFIIMLNEQMIPIWHAQTEETIENAKVYFNHAFSLNGDVILGGSFYNECQFQNYSLFPDLDFDNFLLSLDTANTIFNFQIENAYLYPNPATNIIHLQNLPTIASHIDIYDIAGQLILSTPPQNQINVNSLDSGVYCLTIIANGIVYSSRFVKE